MARVELRDFVRVFEWDVVAVKTSVWLEKTKYLFFFAGPSGCCKSTIPWFITDLVNITSGEINIGKKTVNYIPAKDRTI